MANNNNHQQGSVPFDDDGIVLEEDDGYGACAGCGGWEPKEVLEQMNGYCSSECERDYGPGDD